MNWGAVEASGIPLRLILDNPITGTVLFSDTISNLPPADQILISARLEDAPASAATVFAWLDPERTLLQTRSDNDLASTKVRRLPRPPIAIVIEGPTKGTWNESYTFTAYVQPFIATTPLTYTWQATGQATVIHTGGLTDTASFTWSAIGAQTITLTAANVDGVVTHAYDHHQRGHTHANADCHTDADGHAHADIHTDIHTDAHADDHADSAHLAGFVI